MDISVCITVFNEEKTIGDLLMALLTQTKKPDEIVIVDGGSTDRTVRIIKHFQKKYKNIKLISQKVSRAIGRNLAVAASKYDIIVVTDAGCIPKIDWIAKIVKPFDKKGTEVVAGFYDMKAVNPMQKAFSVFLGTNPKDFNNNYLPSARSLAFKKRTFEKQSGFPVLMEETAEDTLFASNLVRSGIKIVRVKNARVEWMMPENFKEGITKFYKYALGDIRSGIWFHPVHGIWSHNFKALLILARYIFALVLFVFSFKQPLIFAVLFVFIILYLIRSFVKVFYVYKDIKSGLWGIVVQIASDIQIMRGLIVGYLKLQK